MRRCFLIVMLLMLAGAGIPGAASAQPRKPNILLIWGDDAGMYNISAYHRGMMGGSTPIIDRLAKQGMLFVDHYAQASWTSEFKPPEMDRVE